MAVIVELLQNPNVLQGVAVALLTIFASHYFRDFADGFPYSKIPLVGKSRWELSNQKAKTRFVNGARELIKQGFSQVRTLLLMSRDRY